MAVTWLKRLVASLSPRRSGFDPGSVHVGFVVDKVALGQEKGKKIIITGLHNKSQGCGAFVSSTTGPFTKKKKKVKNTILKFVYHGTDYTICILIYLRM
jgi:hypothetical protein